MTDAEERAAVVAIPQDILDFIMGTGPLEGHWFGETNPKRKGKFWWRSVIRERLAVFPRGEHLRGGE